jgi:hypothetical protein
MDDARQVRLRAAADAVYADFVEAMNDLAGTHAMSIAGIIQMKAFVEREILPGKGPGDKLFVGHGSPQAAESFVWQSWEVVGLPARLGGDGHVAGDLGRQWLVMVASLWNDEFRTRFAEASEVDRFDDAGLGDINKMRNDIIHHSAVATARNTGRCETFRWFLAGETIHPRAVHVANFMSYIGQAHRAADVAPGMRSHRFGASEDPHA